MTFPTRYSDHRGDTVAFRAFVEASSRYDRACKCLVTYGYTAAAVIGAYLLMAALAPNQLHSIERWRTTALLTYLAGAGLLFSWCLVACARMTRARATFNQALRQTWGG